MGIFVRNVERLERFYTHVFNLLVTDRGVGQLLKHDLVFLSADPTKHHQLVLASGRGPEALSTVMQISFKVQTLRDLRRIANLALAEGATRLRTMDHGNSWSAYFADPEDNTVEVYLDTPFHVPQPYARGLDLSQPDAHIVAETERLCRLAPGFMLREDFSRSLQIRLEEGGGS